jgi:Concanavalin A-like lectin/glucanases superfamily
VFYFQCALIRVAIVASLLTASTTWAQDLARWQPQPTGWAGASVTQDKATLRNDRWSYLVAPGQFADVDVSATVTIDAAASQFRFFGESWSVWPDPTFGDQGFDTGLLLRGDAKGACGYRVQVSYKLQEVALLRFPDGGYLRSVPCELKLKTPIQLRAAVAGGVIRVSVDGRDLIHYVDRVEPALKPGRVGIGVSSAATVTFTEPTIAAIEGEAAAAAQPHQVNLRVRRWLGGRAWVFDGDEPIMLLPSLESSYINNVKLRPGYKPQLSWNSHWDTQNQGAYKEAENATVDVRTSGGGQTLTVSWRGKHVHDQFGTKTTMTVGFDGQRGTYTYNIDSELEVYAGQPFTFRYGYDFEHHTPLDPFNWQYLIARRRNGELYRRPVYPIDPGPQYDLEPYHGLRVWYGRHNGDFQVAPAVEYAIDPTWNQLTLADSKTGSRTMNTAVCAAFYDTGVSFGPETAPPETKVRVRYRYTGYPAEEARLLFEHSKTYASPMLDPNHYYIFADEWPTLTFSKFVPMSETWQYGRTPFMTGHNQRPSYELQKDCGAGSGFAMKLGPASFAKANWPMPGPLSKGRYILSALVKSINAHGPGGHIEAEATEAKTGRRIAAAKHFVGNGSFDWKRTGFVLELPKDAAALSLAFGNAGTGDMLITDVQWRRFAEGDTLADGIAPKPNDVSPAFAAAPAGAIADFRMEDGRGFDVMNYAGGEHLQLANLDWVVDEGRRALRFADNPSGPARYRHDSALARNYLDHPSYEGRSTVPVAIAGHHGGGGMLKGLTLAAWIKPAPQMGRGEHGGKGDIIGYGARRFILSLRGQRAPYQLVARINVNDRVESVAGLDADRWRHVAMTAEPSAAQWKVRLFIDGRQAAEGVTTKFPADAVVPNSIILGAELFYLHDAYYRGLIGRTLVFDRALSADELRRLAE